MPRVRWGAKPLRRSAFDQPRAVTGRRGGGGVLTAIDPAPAVREGLVGCDCRVAVWGGWHAEWDFEGQRLGGVVDHQARCECVVAQAFWRALELETAVLGEISRFHVIGSLADCSGRLAANPKRGCVGL